jgi:enoyl-CoA hydratase
MEARWHELYRKLRLRKPESGIIEVVLDRPETRNSMDAETHAELTRVWLDIDADPEVRVAVVYGVGGAFSAGGDFSLLEANIRDPEARVRAFHEARMLVYNILNCSKPIISAIEGPAVGAGLATALLADISVAARSARLIDGHVRLGVAAGDHAALIWPLLVGMAKAKYYLLLNEPITGEEAERIGLVSLCVEDGKAYETAVGLARRLRDGSALAISWTKYALNNWLRLAGPIFDTSVALEMLGFSLPDVVEGVKSLKEKRAPQFSWRPPLSALEEQFSC